MVRCGAFAWPLFLSLLGAAATRHEPPAAFLGVHGREAMVPSSISKALQGAIKASRSHLQALTAAQEEAATKKAKQESATAKKVALLEEARTQVATCEEEEKQSREAMVSLEKANAEHALHSGALEKAVDLWNQLSSQLEALQKGVAAQEEEMTEKVAAMQSALEDKKKAMEEKQEERDAAEQDMAEKKDKALAAGKLKKETEEQQVAAEKRSKQAQEALLEIQGKVEEAVEAALKAHLEEAEAGDQVAAAKRNHEKGAESLRLLRKLKTAVEDFFDAMDALDQNMMSTEGQGKAHERILSDTHLEPTLTKYNLMVVAFTDVFSFGEATYKKVEPSIDQIVDNTKAAMELACDPNKELGHSMAESPELEEKCWTALWRHLGITELRFPGQGAGPQAMAAAASSPEAVSREMEAPLTEPSSEDATQQALEKMTEVDTETTDSAAGESLPPSPPLAHATSLPTLESAGTMTDEQLQPLPEDALKTDVSLEASPTPTTSEELQLQPSPEEALKADVSLEAAATPRTTEDTAELLDEETMSSPKSAAATESTTPEDLADLLGESSVTPPKDLTAQAAEAEETSGVPTQSRTTPDDVGELLDEGSLSPKQEAASVSDLLGEESMEPKAREMTPGTGHVPTESTNTAEDVAELLGEDSSAPKQEQGSSSPSDIMEERPPASAHEDMTDNSAKAMELAPSPSTTPHLFESIAEHFMPVPESHKVHGADGVPKQPGTEEAAPEEFALLVQKENLDETVAAHSAEE